MKAPKYFLLNIILLFLILLISVLTLQLELFKYVIFCYNISFTSFICKINIFFLF